MHKDIRLHGLIDNTIEYYAIIAGMDAHQRYFFNSGYDDEQLRFFSPGNEFVIGKQGIKLYEIDSAKLDGRHDGLVSVSPGQCEGWRMGKL